MNSNGHRFSRETREQFWRAVRTFLGSRDGVSAVRMLIALVVLLLAINALNVVNSYVGRDFISAIAARNIDRFVVQAWFYVGVFALSTVAAVICRYFEERLGLVWRDWQTRQILDSYVDRRAYYELEQEGRLENADQRIAEDVRTFTTSTLSFLLMTLNASITVLMFSGVLWSISPKLFVVAVLYALAGSAITVLVGRRLIGLNVTQLDKEANFRSELVHLREHAESVAVLQRETLQHRRLLQRLTELVANTRRMISVNRNLGFFSNGYNYLIQIIPALIIAPMYIHGQIEFGVVTQAAMAFAMLMGAFSLAVTQFQLISSYAAVIARLGRLIEAIDRSRQPAPSSIVIEHRAGPLQFDRLSLRHADGHLLLDRLSLELRAGTRMLITATSGLAKHALFNATAGLHCEGEGRIVLPDADTLRMVPERPYIPKATVRELLRSVRPAPATTDDELWSTLQQFGIAQMVIDAGGLDVERDWSSLVGVGELTKLVLAEVLLARPQFVLLDRLSLSLDAEQAQAVLQLFDESRISYLVMGKPGDYADRCDARLHIAADGSWTYTPLNADSRISPV